MLPICGFWLAAQICTDVHLARLIAGVQKAALDVHDIPSASGSATSASVRMHRKRALCPHRRGGRISERTRFKRSSRSIRARSRALRSVAPDVALECASLEEDVMSLARRESRADFLVPLLQLLDTVFCAEDNNIVLEARSILYAVPYAHSKYPPGRLLILSDNLALVLALCKEDSTNFTMLSVMRRIVVSGFRAGFVSSFRWIPSELSHSDHGSRFCDRDRDPSK